ncbi:MAG TPA: DNA mismatch repair protein MutS [Thermoanaerobaculia bacterium]
MQPRELYAERLTARQTETTALLKRERTISLVRLVLIAAAIGLAFLSGWLTLIPVALFVALLVVHEKTIRARKRAQASAKFFELGLSRLDGTWSGRGVGGAEFIEEHHPYAGDLDLFGNGSLFEMICIAVTTAGRARLASWLKAPEGSMTEVRARQEAVAELRENVPLREDLAIAATEVARDVEAAKLDEWSSMPPMVIGKGERLAARVLPIITAAFVLLMLPKIFAELVGLTHEGASLQLGMLADVPAWPLIPLFLAELWIARGLGARIEHVVSAVERTEPALALFAGVLHRLEREQFSSPRLASLRARLDRDGQPASEQIERLRKLVALLDARRNQFFAPIGMMLLWTTNVAIAIERWRVESGRDIVAWIEAVAELEALASLASFAFEHPDFAMPALEEEGPLFDAQSLGHPLIPADRRVTNDLRLDRELRLLVVSGSNMSGKSTMMRSVGIAAILGLAGAPVCARSLRLAPMAVGASIRINDSLQEGASRFYAEILRIRQVLELSRGPVPLLFLLDEILAGTNSHDRRIGAEAVVRGLVERGAAGLMSTHDLALAQIVETVGARAKNVHFEDHIEEGRVVFDYKMREGVVTKSNALALMRSVGIEV